MEVSKIVELSRNQNFEPIHKLSKSDTIIALIDKALAEIEADVPLQ